MNDRVRGGLAAAFLGVLLGGPATAAVTGFVNNPTTNSQDLANWVASHQGALNKTVDFSTHPLGPLQSGFYSSQGVTLTGTGVYTNVVFGAGPGQINPGTSPGEGPHAPSNFLGTSQITFTTWYQNRSSMAFGSEFRFTQSFTVQGDAAALRSVEVTLTSGAGSSAPVSANY
ncbi:MAG: hypothetical protein HY013_06310 [Candidatus Solibacter usitatus]|nr:hypothetical protein [Candidatus Solibacter usitatus]